MPFGLCPGFCLATASWVLAAGVIVSPWLPRPSRSRTGNNRGEPTQQQ